ncbi:hypothetical protein [Oceaniglobus indicus]|uniref:hypothetical protein n=1 Tax=Oceaniglobus indicus TaxID=2047749 RepID=UPI000C17D3AF|nr:hypothetical protein [Oceaniglobus indicus]
MIRRLVVTGLMVLAMAGQAAALSCRAPDAQRSFDAAAKSDGNFIVVHGRFAFDAGELPRGDNQSQQPPVAIPARFEGAGLTVEGFTTPLAMGVTLNVSCAGPWCGGIGADIDYLAFLERRIGGYVLEIGPCPQWAFQTPSTQILDQMRTAIRGGDTQIR